ncbi:MAG: D-alanyl-D-alanine carboxypeptidase, partial [Clostridia bacterium]|nr:D-alanyl-D-alanine carboxypeptidase [Clostridia bacterium]
QSTGRVLFAQNEYDHLPIASVTKVMSALLITEAIDSGRIAPDETVTVSENAASMGGSQVYLEPNEQMTVRDLLKALVVSSANDATVALGEHVCGSEATFVAEMNRRAEELGCENTHFVNTNGLPAEGHYSCAFDIALITRELMNHPMIFEYSGIWTDTIRNGSFGLSNTNKLIRFYKGATGMKTGFTAEAGFCLSGTAKRDGMQLIAVVLGCSTSDKRFSAAKNLLDHGFANYCVKTPPAPEPQPVKLTHGEKNEVRAEVRPAALLDDKNARGEIETRVELPQSVRAPVCKGDVLGQVVYTRGGEELARADIAAAEDVPEMTYGAMLKKLLSAIFRL